MGVGRLKCVSDLGPYPESGDHFESVPRDLLTEVAFTTMCACFCSSALDL